MVNVVPDGRGGVASDADIIDFHAGKWLEHANKLRGIANLTVRMRFRNIGNAGMFTEVMGKHDAVVQQAFRTYQEGAAIWDMMGHYLKMAHAALQHQDEESLREYRTLHDLVATGWYNPMRTTGPNPFPLAK